jgi:hypothetical protein
MSRFYLNTERESSLRNVVLKYKQDGVLDKNRKMDNIQKHNICKSIIQFGIYLICRRSESFNEPEDGTDFAVSRLKNIANDFSTRISTMKTKAMVFHGESQIRCKVVIENKTLEQV